MKESSIPKRSTDSSIHEQQEMFRLLFESQRDKVYSYALRLTRVQALAEDIVQDIFMKVWQNLHQLSSIDNKEGWIFRITRNHCFNILKRMALENRTSTALAETRSEVSDTERAVSQHASQQLFDQALQQLPRRQKQVFYLCHNKGLKYEEAAYLLNISTLTVKTHMQYALRSIRAYFLKHADR